VNPASARPGFLVRRRAARELAGPLITGGVVLAIHVVWLSVGEIPSVGVLLLMPVGYSVLLGGIRMGFASSAIALLYLWYHLLEPGAPLRYDAEEFARVGITTIAMPFFVLTLGLLRSRLALMSARVRTERQRAADILESITDGFFALDREWRYVYVNRRAEQLVGRSRADLLGRVVWEAFPPLVGSTWDREYRRAMQDQVPVVFEELYAPLGTWFETHAYPSRDGLTIYLSDISERKTAEEALKALVRQRAALAVLGLRALAEVDLQSVMDEAVQVVASTLAVEYAKILELLPDGDRLLLRAGVGWRDGAVGNTTVGSGEASQAGYTLRSREPFVVADLRKETRFSGPALLLEHGVVSGLSVVIGDPEHPFGVLGAHTRASRWFTEDDISFVQAVANVVAEAVARGHAEQNLRDSEERFRELAENIREVFFVTDPRASEIPYVSPAYEDIWGRSRESLYREPRSWLDTIHPGDRMRVEAAISDLARSERDAQFRIARPDGEVRWIRIRAFPVRDDSGTTYRVVGIAEDVTARKQAEESARRLALEQAARTAAEAAVQARDEALAVVSHDLRSPLNAIAFSAAALRDPISEERRARLVQLIEQSADRMKHLVSDLLDVARIEAGRLAIESAPLDLRGLVEETCGAFRAQAWKRNVRLEADVPDHAPAVLADGDRLLQVLSNLTGNAIKFTPEGGRVGIRVEVRPEDVRVSVSDTGPGIRTEDLPRLFDRFWQARRPDRRGAGLGLAIAKGIVEAHGGRLWAESSPGEGSTFWFTLPRMEPSPPPQPPLATRQEGIEAEERSAIGSAERE
jgi:PAS domain S-box-containing protein